VPPRQSSQGKLRAIDLWWLEEIWRRVTFERFREGELDMVVSRGPGWQGGIWDCGGGVHSSKVVRWSWRGCHSSCRDEHYHSIMVRGDREGRDFLEFPGRSWTWAFGRGRTRISNAEAVYIV
jgi:hypothetical protein